MLDSLVHAFDIPVEPGIKLAELVPEVPCAAIKDLCLPKQKLLEVDYLISCAIKKSLEPPNWASISDLVGQDIEQSVNSAGGVQLLCHTGISFSCGKKSCLRVNRHNPHIPHSELIECESFDTVDVPTYGVVTKKATRIPQETPQIHSAFEIAFHIEHENDGFVLAAYGLHTAKSRLLDPIGACQEQEQVTLVDHRKGQFPIGISFVGANARSVDNSQLVPIVFADVPSGALCSFSDCPSVPLCNRFSYRALSGHRATKEGHGEL